jgi:sugar phosphate isomerase/epimerase
MQISFISANLVARPLGWKMTRNWAQGESANEDLFRPEKSFAERFEEMIERIVEMGFSSIDLWNAHLHPAWATSGHLDAARAVLRNAHIRVTAYASHWGKTEADLDQVVRVMRALDTDLLSGNFGMLSDGRECLGKALRDRGLKLAYENHPEKSADEILEKIGASDHDVVGVAFDTGWAASQGYDATEAVNVLAPRLFHFHAKDVLARRQTAAGYALIDMGHETCALGDGIVGIEAALKQAEKLGFDGPVGIEHEPETYDPSAECRTSLHRVRSWLPGAKG